MLAEHKDRNIGTSPGVFVVTKTSILSQNMISNQVGFVPKPNKIIPYHIHMQKCTLTTFVLVIGLGKQLARLCPKVAKSASQHM